MKVSGTHVPGSHSVAQCQSNTPADTCSVEKEACRLICVGLRRYNHLTHGPYIARVHELMRSGSGTPNQPNSAGSEPEPEK